MFKKVAIVGTGLIGGSLGLAIKKKRIAAEVVGVSRRMSSILLAKKMGAIDAGSTDFSIIRGSDLVILSIPVHVILDSAQKLSRFCAEGAIVTDVGSAKEEIVLKLEKFFPNFLGSHPLAGSEKRGVAHADGGIFRGSLCILTPTKKTASAVLKRIKALWKVLGARIAELSPKAHDRILSLTSHLPHVAAFSLIESVPQEFFKFSAGGLRDTTRIAGSDALLWADIFLSNRGNIISAISALEKNIRGIKSALSTKDRGALERILKKAKEKREKLQ